MINFLTGLALIGAAVTAIACAIAKLIIENGKRKIEDRPQFLARKSLGDGGSILHSKFSIHTAVFVFFAAIATLSAQKSGTNAPPNGASPPSGNVELWNLPPLVENEQIHHSPFSILHSQ